MHCSIGCVMHFLQIKLALLSVHHPCRLPMLVCSAVDIVHTGFMGSRIAESMRAALDSSVQALLS